MVRTGLLSHHFAVWRNSAAWTLQARRHLCETSQRKHATEKYFLLLVKPNQVILHAEFIHKNKVEVTRSFVPKLLNLH